eukprot:GHVT01073163.1.p1 GENE.GHVT01073163.1~~GHVT01073163.1.p1  ORF type:complete len:191 (+),score=40.58 GHVT01073163.1:452-1024(+)
MQSEYQEALFRAVELHTDRISKSFWSLTDSLEISHDDRPIQTTIAENFQLKIHTHALINSHRALLSASADLACLATTGATDLVLRESTSGCEDCLRSLRLLEERRADRSQSGCRVTPGERALLRCADATVEGPKQAGRGADEQITRAASWAPPLPRHEKVVAPDTQEQVLATVRAQRIERNQLLQLANAA